VNELNNIVAQLEKQRAAIDNALAALRGISGQETTTTKTRGRPKGSKQKRVVSDEGRQRQIEAMRRYWAAKKAAAKKTATKKRAAKKVSAA